MVHNRRQSEACKDGTSYRSVIGRLIKFAETELLELYPDLSREQRIIKAHQEPFWTASKELRDLTIQEYERVKAKANLEHKKI